MTDFRDRLREELDHGYQAEEAYDRAAANVRKEHLVEHFRPLGIEEARHLLRGASRRNENRVFGVGDGTLVRSESEPKVLDVRGILARTVWYRGDGTTVSWLDATIEDHEERADAQEQRAEALHVDADRHRRAAKILRETKKGRLADVKDADLERVTD